MNNKDFNAHEYLLENGWKTETMFAGRYYKDYSVRIFIEIHNKKHIRLLTVNWIFVRTNEISEVMNKTLLDHAFDLARYLDKKKVN